jgi:hypothetical protein
MTTEEVNHVPSKHFLKERMGIGVKRVSDCSEE